MTGRTLVAITLAAVALLAGTLFLFVAVLPVLIGAGVLMLALCAGVLALGSGHLPWIEIEEVATPEKRHRLWESLRLHTWSRAVRH